MTQYTGTQSVLNESLGRYLSLGFSLVEDSNHDLYLYHYGILISKFIGYEVTVAEVQEACQKHLED
jgi:hypothetical protein